MAKTFYTTGTGSNQTLTNIQDEKIPIYDSQQDAESDLANLEVGQVVLTKESKFDIDNMKQYIRNQNVLSDWENITLPTTLGTAIEMKYDGFIWGYSAYAFDIYINNVRFIFSDNDGAGSMFAFKKGDKIYVSASNYTYARVCYYELRDYTDR